MDRHLTRHKSDEFGKTHCLQSVRLEPKLVAQTVWLFRHLHLPSSNILSFIFGPLPYTPFMGLTNSLKLGWTLFPSLGYVHT